MSPKNFPFNTQYNVFLDAILGQEFSNFREAHKTRHNFCNNLQDFQCSWNLCACTTGSNISDSMDYCRYRCPPGICTCSPLMFQCSTGGCIPYSRVCDNVYDCRFIGWVLYGPKSSKIPYQWYTHRFTIHCCNIFRPVLWFLIFI